MELIDSLVLILLIWNLVIAIIILYLYAKITTISILVKQINPEKLVKDILNTKIPIFTDGNGQPIAGGIPLKMPPIQNPLTG